MSNTPGDILVVDDQPVNVRLLATMLSQLGYKVRKATSGEMALTAIHAELPDLILLDITMPQMDGYELCEILKKDPNTADIPVIFVSALDESMDKTKAFEVGAVDYVAKPFQWVEVQARVKTQLALRALQRQHSMAGNTETQAALWAKSMPEIAHFEIVSHPFNPSSSELFDWLVTAPNALQLTLANSSVAPPLSTVLLATVRGIFKGLSANPSLPERVRCAQVLLAHDLGAGESLPLFHGELNESDSSALRVRTLIYSAEGYTLALIRQQTIMVQSASGSIMFEPGDRLFIFRTDLLSVELQLTNALMKCVQGWAGSTSSAVMLGQVADELKSAINYEGSVTMLYCLL
jgi:CheY-like chemotaxis protein